MIRNEQSSHLWMEFFGWLLMRFFLPILPLFIEFLVKGIFLADSQFTFPNQTVIILAFLLPIITMTEQTVKTATSFFLMIISMMALILFTLATVAEIEGNRVILERLYQYGFFLFIGVIIVHVIPKFVALVRRTRLFDISREKPR